MRGHTLLSNTLTVSAVLSHGLKHPPSEHTSLCATAYINTALPNRLTFLGSLEIGCEFRYAGVEILADLDPASVSEAVTQLVTFTCLG
jgi:hypothetical protein